MSDYNFIPERQVAFNAAYWAAQPPSVVAACKITDFSARALALEGLANSGYIIDKAIMVWGWEAYQTMLTRWCYGYTWVPNILDENNVSTPGITLAGQTPYDPNKPDKNAIIVHDPNTFDLAVWFPSKFTPAPVTTEPVPFVDLSRPWPEMNGWFSTVAGYHVVAGDKHIDPDGKTYIKVIMQWPFGDYHGWKLA